MSQMRMQQKTDMMKPGNHARLPVSQEIAHTRKAMAAMARTME